MSLMAIEIEAKIKVTDLREYSGQTGKISRLGGRPGGLLQQEDRFFDRADGELLAKGCGLRIRNESCQSADTGEKAFDRCIICYKGPLEGQDAEYKQREELELTVDQPETAAKILNSLGFTQILTVKKQRELWILHECEICLDEVFALGSFIEVEGPSNQAVSAVMDGLGLDTNEHINVSYAQLIAKKNSNRP